MIILESLRCGICHEPCKFSVCKAGLGPRFCIDRRQLVCSDCVEKHIPRGTILCPSQLLTAILFANRACPEEASLLDFGKWNPIACDYCHIPFDFNGAREIQCCGPFIGPVYPYDRECVVVHCMQPMCRKNCPKRVCENIEELTDHLAAIMNELRPFFSDKEYVPVKNKSFDDPRMDNLKWLYYCSRCGTDSKSREQFTYLFDGKLFCHSCLTKTNKHTENEDVLHYHGAEVALAQIFPDVDDLNFLTFEKWTPFRCDNCSDVFTGERETYPLYDVLMETFCGECDRETGPERGYGPNSRVQANFIVELNKEIKQYFKSSTGDSPIMPRSRVEVNRLFPETMSDVLFNIKHFLGNGATFKRQNLFLESLRCDTCQQPCQVSVCKLNILPGFCATCWRLLCFDCVKKMTCDCCNSRWPPNDNPVGPTQLHVAMLLASRACPDEAGLLDFGKWNPFVCDYCHTPFEYDGNRGVHCCSTGQNRLHCMQPKCTSQCSLQANDRSHMCKNIPEISERITLIMKELHNYFSPAQYLPVRNKSLLDRRIANLKWFYHCSRCGKDGDMLASNMYLCDGHLVCHLCIEGDESREGNFASTIPLAAIFPDMDALTELTFEQWSPFRCDTCSVVFTEEKEKYPIYHAYCDKTLCAICDSRKKCRCEPGQPDRRIKMKFMVDMNKEIKQYFNGGKQAIQTDSLSRKALPSWLERNKNFALTVSDVSFSRENLLGNGAQAHVFKGTYKEQDVAVKSFLKQKAGTQDEFLLELEQFIHLRHPNLLKLTGYVLEERWIVLEYCPNQTLSDYIHDLSANNILDWRTLVQWTFQIIQGIQYLHSNEVTHRDLKPDNILIAADWTLQIGDFARSRSGNLTNTAYVTGNIGTKGYMAPELIAGHAYGKKVDVWSFGVILWELCSRQRPFFGVDGNWATDNIRLGKLRLPELVPLPDEVNNVITMCLSFTAEKRPSFEGLKNGLWKEAADAVKRHADRWPELVKMASEKVKNHHYQVESGTTRMMDKNTYLAQAPTELKSSELEKIEQETANQTRRTNALDGESAARLTTDKPMEDDPSSSLRREDDAQETGRMPWEW